MQSCFISIWSSYYWRLCKYCCGLYWALTGALCKVQYVLWPLSLKRRVFCDVVEVFQAKSKCIHTYEFKCHSFLLQLLHLALLGPVGKVLGTWLIHIHTHIFKYYIPPSAFTLLAHCTLKIRLSLKGVSVWGFCSCSCVIGVKYSFEWVKSCMYHFISRWPHLLSVQTLQVKGKIAKKYSSTGSSMNELHMPEKLIRFLGLKKKAFFWGRTPPIPSPRASWNITRVSLLFLYLSESQAFVVITYEIHSLCKST